MKALQWGAKVPSLVRRASTIIPEARTALKTMSVRQQLFRSNKAAAILKEARTQGILKGEGIWTKGPKPSEVQNAFVHWKRHYHDFPNLKNSKEYVEFAHEYINNPPSGSFMKIRNNGEIIIYNQKNNTIGFYTNKNIPKSLYKPNKQIHKRKSNFEYFYDQ